MSPRAALRRRLRELVRRFKENGIKLLLEHPENVRELLPLTGSPLVQAIDFSRLQVVKTTFVRRDYSHVESDIVFVAPLLTPGGRRLRRRIMLYILIEHQSEPDRLIPLRLLDYQVQIFNYQKRQWSRQHRSLAAFRLEPVLPIVLYTGTRSWDSLGTMADLIQRGDEFRGVTAGIESPLFINLPTLSPDLLTSQGGYFGTVLRLIQQRAARPEEFRDLLERTINHLETMPAAERQRWLDLMSYIHALIYHEREPAEQQRLQETIEQSVQTDPHRQEVFYMGKTIAQDLIDKGRREGRREASLKSLRDTLLRQLAKRFGDVPADVRTAIAAEDDIAQLDEWLDRFATARSLQDIGIG